MKLSSLSSSKFQRRKDSKKTAGLRPSVGGLVSQRMGILDSVGAVKVFSDRNSGSESPEIRFFPPMNASSRAGGIRYFFSRQAGVSDLIRPSGVSDVAPAFSDPERFSATENYNGVLFGGAETIHRAEEPKMIRN